VCPGSPNINHDLVVVWELVWELVVVVVILSSGRNSAASAGDGVQQSNEQGPATEQNLGGAWRGDRGDRG
jgi:hypothetical protein